MERSRLFTKPAYNIMVALHALSMAVFLLVELLYTVKLLVDRTAGRISTETLVTNGLVMIFLCLSAQVVITLTYLATLFAEYLKARLYQNLLKEG